MNKQDISKLWGANETQTQGVARGQRKRLEELCLAQTSQCVAVRSWPCLESPKRPEAGVRREEWGGVTAFGRDRAQLLLKS